MTNKETVERVKSLYQTGVSSDDNRMSDRLIYSVISTAKAMVLRQEVSKNRKLSERNYDFLECVPLSKAEAHDCPCAPPSGCLILKSDCTLPRPLHTKNGEYITVSSIDGSKSFPKTTWLAKSKKKGNKYTSKTQDSFFKDDYLYITAPTNDAITLKTITVMGIFEDISDFYCNYCEDCDDDATSGCTAPLDKEFKLDYALIERVIEVAVSELIRMFSLRQDDKLNNANDDTQTQTPQQNTRRPVL